MKKSVLLVVSLILLVSLLVGCTSSAPATNTSSEPSAPAASEPSDGGGGVEVKVAYVCKMLTNPWFVAEDNGLKDKAAELGVTYFSIDADLDDEKCDAAINNAIAQGINGLAICITNQGNGPQVAMKCREKGIALVTLDDNIVDENGDDVPHVGLPVKEVGYLGGEALAKLANDRDFFAEGNVVKVLQIDAPDITVLWPRLEGYMEALIENTPLTKDDFVYAETSECMLEDSLATAQATIQAYPEVTHWICGAVNDDSAIAFLKAIEEQGKIPLENLAICGLGGYSMSVEEFEKGNDSYMTIVLNPYGEGQAAMQILYDNITKGTPLPLLTLINGNIANLSNWDDLIAPENR